MELAQQALRIFEACRKALEAEAQNRSKFDSPLPARDVWKKTLRQIPLPKTFPASLEDFLGLVVGGKTKTTRESTFLNFLGDSISAGLVAGVPPALADSAPESVAWRNSADSMQ